MDVIHDLTARFREYVSNPRIQAPLIAEKGKWLQICTSLDLIEDSQLAISSYPVGDPVNESGALYLQVYGLLQAFVLQQDATFHLCEALCIEDHVWNYPGLKALRDLRVFNAGHPVKQSVPKEPPYSYHSIVRGSLRKDGFEFYSQSDDGDRRNRFVEISDVIGQQAKYVDEALGKAMAELERRDLEHRERFKGDNLTGHIPKSIDWALGKISEFAQGSSTHNGFAIAGVETAKKVLSELEMALKRRDMTVETYDAIKYAYEKIRYPLAKLDDWLNGTAPLDNEAADIFVSYLCDEFATLRRIVIEIDAEYAE